MFIRGPQDFTLMPGGTVEGVVMDLATGQPVPDAVVVADGRFLATGLSPGTYTLHAKTVGGGQDSDEPVVVALGIGEQVDGVELWVVARPSVAGQVVDETGAPVADALVLAEGPGMVSSFTDGDGAFQVRGLRADHWLFTAAGGRGATQAGVVVELDEAPVTGVVLKLASAARIVGRVEPAIAAEIELGIDFAERLRAGRDTALARLQQLTATAGPDGRFELAPVQGGTVTLTARTSDGRRGTIELVVPGSGDVEAVIPLEVAGSLAGRVVDERGAPVPGAVVLVGGRVRNFYGPEVNGVNPSDQHVPTDAEGNFRVGALAAAEYRLTVIDTHGALLRWAGADQVRAPKRITLADREDLTGIMLAVEVNRGIIRGLVRNADGTPRADAWITAALDARERRALFGDDPGAARAATGGIGGTPPVLSGADGRFEIVGLRRGIYDVTAEAERGTIRGRTGQVAVGTDVVVTIAGLATVTGTVTSAGKPVGVFTVDLIKPRDEGRRSQRVHDDAGHFRLTRVEPGRYQLRVLTATGSANRELTITGEPTAPLSFEIAGELATVHGQIVDAAGQPVANVTVSARATPPSTSTPGEVTTTASGRFDLDVEAGSYTLLVEGAATTRRFTATDGQTLMIEPTTQP